MVPEALSVYGEPMAIHITGAWGRGQVWRVPLAALMAVAASCGGEVVQTAPATELAEAGVPVPADLPRESPFGDWTPEEPRAESDRVDTTFSRCGDPTDQASFGDAAVQPEESVISPVFNGTASGATKISLDVRGASLVFADAEAAGAAYEALDAEAFAPCITGSVDPDADAPDVGFRGTGDGEQGKRLDLSLDDYQYFEGNDNQTDLHLRVFRVGRVVAVVQFVYSGQYFEDVGSDLDRLGDDVTSSVAARLEQG
jgi:hypothetical protein